MQPKIKTTAGTRSAQQNPCGDLVLKPILTSVELNTLNMNIDPYGTEMWIRTAKTRGFSEFAVLEFHTAHERIHMYRQAELTAECIDVLSLCDITADLYPVIYFKYLDSRQISLVCDKLTLAFKDADTKMQWFLTNG